MDTGTGAKVAQNQQNVRAAERFDLEVKVDLESDHNFYTGLTQNISSGGVFIATHHIRKIGDRITLKFSLPGSAEPLAVETEVRWIRENTALMRARRRHRHGRSLHQPVARSAAAIDAVRAEPRVAVLRRRGLRPPHARGARSRPSGRSFAAARRIEDRLTGGAGPGV